MNRRSFITKVLVGAAAIPLIGKLAQATESTYFKPVPTVYGLRKYGRTSVQTHPELCGNVRIFLDGVDISNECFEADDVNGYARVCDRNESGEFYVDRERREVASRKVFGRVSIVPRISPDADAHYDRLVAYAKSRL